MISKNRHRWLAFVDDLAITEQQKNVLKWTEEGEYLIVHTSDSRVRKFTHLSVTTEETLGGC